MCRIRIGRFWVKLSLSKRGRMQNLSCVACEQALLGTLAAWREKEGELATTSLEFEYLHRKIDAKC